MRKILIITILSLAATIAVNIVLLARVGTLSRQLSELSAEPVSVQEPLPACEPSEDWDAFILALAWTESGWDAKAVGKADDVGWLQITPVIVRDANRIVGKEKYKLSDRTSKAKSVEMFNVIQDRYNPGHDLQLAMKVWNPRAPLAYHRNTLKKYNELRSL